MKLETLRRLIVAENGGFASAALHAVLWLPSRLYGIIMRIRNFAYDRRLARISSVDAAVICVGNLTTGGTGKTPLTIWIAALIQRKGLPCGILTRGYKTLKGRLSDEPAILSRACPDAKVFVDSDRVAGAAAAIKEHGARVLLMDDGFQHRRLARDVDIVAIDATCPFGGGRLLPAGLLREPLSSLRRASAVIITRSDMVDPDALARLEERIRRANPNIPIARSIHSPRTARMLKNKELPLEMLAGRKIFAFCGIGNPDAFFATLSRIGLVLSATEVFNDHHDYTIADVRLIYEKARACDAEAIVTTQKDWVKTALAASRENKWNIPLAYLDISLKFTAAEDEIVALIENALARKASPSADI